MPDPATLPSNVISELKALLGDKSVLTQPGDLYLYSFDSALDRATPSAVLIPSTTDHVSLAVSILARNRIPFVARGAATSLCGGPIPFKNGVVIALAHLKKIGKFDFTSHEISVEPGVVNLKLQQFIAEKGMFFPPDPGSQKACTIGGNVATNAGGPHCLKYGVTSQFVLGVDVVLPNGHLVSFRVEDPGYDLTGFFVGSEGTLGIATKIRLKILPKPKVIRTMLVAFQSMEEAIQSVTDIIAAGVLPATLEAMDKTVVAAVEAFVHAGYPLAAEAVLLIEVDGDLASELDPQVKMIQELCEKNNMSEFRFAKDEAESAKLWEGRRGSYAAMARLAPNVLVEDGAVPRTKLPEALKEIKRIAEEANLRVALLFHAGDGNLHPQIIFDERDVAQTRKVKEAGHKMLKACVDLGGTISGEHGIGIDKREAMKWLFTRETLQLFRRLKNVFDPDNLCNPDKLIPLVGRTVEAVSEEPDFEYKISNDGFIRPSTEEELFKTMQTLAKEKRPFGVIGTGAKSKINESLLIQMTGLNQILDLDRGNLTVTVQAGATLSDVKETLEKENLFLWVSGKGTVGGIIATKTSVQPPLRDLILGMRVLLPTGEVVKLGAKTMKNVAGYDVGKLLIGSWGTLGIILDVTFRLFPYAYSPGLKYDPAVKPFFMKDLHKKIKLAFDPRTQLATRLAHLTETDLNDLLLQVGRQKIKNIPSDSIQKSGDGFWN